MRHKVRPFVAVLLIGCAPGSVSGPTSEPDPDGQELGGDGDDIAEEQVDAPPLPPTCNEEFGCRDAGANAGEAEVDAADASAPVGVVECAPGMECRPGSVRYCDVADVEWTRSTCDATGQWGPCEPTAALINDGCDEDDYSPELCCPPLFLCCQDDPGGPFVDFGSGACDAVTCP